MHCFIKSPVEVSALGRTSSSRKGPEARVMAVPAVSGRHSQKSWEKGGGASHGTVHRAWQGHSEAQGRMEIWGDLAPQKLPEWNPQTQVLLGVLGRPGTLSGPAWPFWVCGFVTAPLPQSLLA